MNELVDFLLHLAFGGFLFLCLIYVLRVVFFLSPRESSLSSVENISGSVEEPERGRFRGA